MYKYSWPSLCDFIIIMRNLVTMPANKRAVTVLNRWRGPAEDSWSYSLSCRWRSPYLVCRPPGAWDSVAFLAERGRSERAPCRGTTCSGTHPRSQRAEQSEEGKGDPDSKSARSDDDASKREILLNHDRQNTRRQMCCDISLTPEWIKWTPMSHIKHAKH